MKNNPYTKPLNNALKNQDDLLELIERGKEISQSLWNDLLSSIERLTKLETAFDQGFEIQEDDPFAGEEIIFDNGMPDFELCGYWMSM